MKLSFDTVATVTTVLPIYEQRTYNQIESAIKNFPATNKQATVPDTSDSVVEIDSTQDSCGLVETRLYNTVESKSYVPYNL